MTDHAGNTGWQDSPLIQAARQGKLVVLDNLAALPGDTLAAVLAPLATDRELALPDGSRLVRSSDGSPNTVVAHPAFRIIALSTPPSVAQSWLHPDLIGCFDFVSTPDWHAHPDEVRSILRSVDSSGATAEAVADFTLSLQERAARLFADEP